MRAVSIAGTLFVLSALAALVFGLAHIRRVGRDTTRLADEELRRFRRRHPPGAHA